MDYAKLAIQKHLQWHGKLSVEPKMKVDTAHALSLAYTPGVAAPCLEIQKDPAKSYDLTGRWNTVAVVTDSTAVLGLGDIGPEAGMPVMEGKCVLFKAFGYVDAIPLCVRSKEPDDIVKAVSLLAGSFGGVNLEDISAPRCFEIEKRLKEICDIPIFHDDQHGTAVITLAGLTNALKVVGKKKEDVKIVTSGAGAAAIAIVKLLLSAGFRNVTMCDRKGAIYKGRDGLNWIKEEMAEVTNLDRKSGSLGCILPTPNAPGQRVFSRCAAPFFLEIRQYSCGKMSCSAQKLLAAGHIGSFQIHPSGAARPYFSYSGKYSVNAIPCASAYALAQQSTPFAPPDRISVTFSGRYASRFCIFNPLDPMTATRISLPPVVL